MSYTLHIYHPDVKRRVEAGENFDTFGHPPLPTDKVAIVLSGLQEYGYDRTEETPDDQVSLKEVSEVPIEVRVFRTEIAFDVSYGKDSEEAIFEALQDASELCDGRGLALYNPQTGEWND